MPPGISTVANQNPVSQQVLQKVSSAFQRDARREGLDEEKKSRFEAWALAFISWCAREESGVCDSGEVRTCRIGEFQVALRGQPEITRQEAVEAMDALAFLFGAAEEAKSALRSLGFSVEKQASSPGDSSFGKSSTGEPSADEARRVFPGWPNEEEGAGETTTEDSLSTNQNTVSRPESHEDASSTAKAFVRAFHSQLDSMHASPPDGSGKGKGKIQSARTQ